jgi:C4-dicarboxylate-specific signal transduction histidine kinase
MTEILRIEELLVSLKSFNMFEQPSLQCIDVASFMRKFVALVHEDFSNDGIVIRTILHPEAQSMQVDPRALQQVLLNILTNSADALEGAEDPKIIMHTFKSGEYVIIRIVDNGCGMTEDQHNDLFKPFVTFKPAGTGLGLTIVRKMLSQMNCVLEITSEKNAGTIVDISVPSGHDGKI